MAPSTLEWIKVKGFEKDFLPTMDKGNVIL